MNKHKIFLDFDETIAMSIKAFVDTYKERHRHDILLEEGYPYPIWEDVFTWNMRCEMPKLELDELNEIFDSPRFFDNLATYADSDGLSIVDFIAELQERNDVEVFIASKGNSSNLHQKRDFLQQKLPFFDLDKFIPMQGTVMNKSELNGLILCDDHEDNLYSANVKYRVLVNYSGQIKEWNARAMGDDSIYKCCSVSDIIRTVNEILCFEKGICGRG